MKKLILIAAVSALGVMSFGQGQRMFRMGGGGMQSSIRLAMREDVGKELALTAEQKAKLQDANDKMREEMRTMFQSMGGPGGGGGGEAPDRAAMEKMMADRAAKEKETVAGILNADQIKRLDELKIQRAGNNALLDANVQTTLKLSDDQKKKITDLQGKQGEAMRALFEKMQNQEIDRDDMRASMEKNQKIMSDELGKVLTADQKKQLADMGGKPFTFDPNEDQGPGGRGGN